MWGLTLANVMIRKDGVHPAVLQSGLWAAVLTAYLLLQGDLPQIAFTTVAVVVSGAFLFSATAHLASVQPRQISSAVVSFNLGSKLFGNASLAIALVGLPFFALKARELGLSGPTENPLLNIRYAINVEGQRFGVLAYLFPVALVSVGFHVLFSRTYSTLRIALVVILACTYAVLFTGRTFLFLILVYSVGVLVVHKRLSVRSAVLLFTIFGASIFAALGLILGKAGSLGMSLVDNIFEIGKSVQAYAVGPLAALDWLVRQDPPLALGDNILRTAHALYAAVDNEQTRVLPLVREFVNVGVATNVYTVYDPYMRDFGIAGALLFIGLIGLGHGFLYRMAVASNNPAWSLAYALSLYPLFMQFFQDQYFSLLSSWIQYAVILIVLGLATGKTVQAQPA